MKELILHCDCHSDHFLVLTVWPDDGDAFLSLAGHWHPGSLGRRLGDAWKALHGKQWHQAEVLLEREDSVRLRDFIDEMTPRLFTRSSHRPPLDLIQKS